MVFSLHSKKQRNKLKVAFQLGDDHNSQQSNARRPAVNHPKVVKNLDTGRKKVDRIPPGKPQTLS